MNNLFKNSYKILKNNLIFMQPLLLYILLCQYATNFLVINKPMQTQRVMILVSLFLLTVAFYAGWLYINKLAVVTYNSDDSIETINKKSIENLKGFATGVGKYFLKFLGGFISVLALTFGSIYGTAKFCMTTVGTPNYFIEWVKTISTANPNDITYEYIVKTANAMPVEESYIVMAWISAFFLMFVVLYLIQNIYFSSLVFEKSNFLVCIFKTIKFFFKNIIGNIVIAIFVLSIFFLFNMFSVLAAMNSILFIILFLVFLYFVNYNAIIMLKYYYDKTKTDSDSRTECIGENGSLR